MRQRPISVIIFGILNIGYALFGYVGILIASAMAHMATGANPFLQAMNSNPNYAIWKSINTGFVVIGGTILLAAGVGLLLLQNWARVISIVWGILDIIFALAGSFFTFHFMQPFATQAKVPPAAAGIMQAMMTVGFVFGLVVALA